MLIRIRYTLLLLFFLMFLTPLNSIAQSINDKIVRVAVIGGMVYADLWREIAKRFEKESGYDVKVVVSGERPELKEAMELGNVDLLTMHSGDITTDLVADGHGINMRPWTRNDLVIWGPSSDPAGIRGMKNGAAALAKIASTQAAWIDFQGIGPREMAHNLWRRAGIKPAGDWVLKDDLGGGRDFLQQVADRNAYIITGRMPVYVGKWKANDKMTILVDQDPTMRRPYIVMETNPVRHPNVNHQGAKALADFLLSEEIQTFLAQYDGVVKDGRPLFYPVWPYGELENHDHLTKN
ncbi:substrate-binding domain-containing protein [Providencia burhodogranariea]|uniref:Tungstate ABC transporter permease n=1 Tax=Providencia burhodogranariea DSM 19968 TaxID=1141662 RepID=K8WVU6_9GAMM|nr:tungstate ABC transporter permease [Providencia burhodogranariea DSM 19968]